MDVNMSQGEYPIFSGRVLGMSLILEDGESSGTVIDYITVKDEPTEEELKKIVSEEVLSVILPEHFGKTEETLESRIKRVVVPMRLDPSVILGAEIRTTFGQTKPVERDRKSFRTYELEIIRGKPQYSEDVVSSILQNRHPTYTGLRYVKVLRDSE